MDKDAPIAWTSETPFYRCPRPPPYPPPLLCLFVSPVRDTCETSYKLQKPFSPRETPLLLCFAVTPSIHSRPFSALSSASCIAGRRRGSTCIVGSPTWYVTRSKWLAEDGYDRNGCFDLPVEATAVSVGACAPPKCPFTFNGHDRCALGGTRSPAHPGTRSPASISLHMHAGPAHSEWTVCTQIVFGVHHAHSPDRTQSRTDARTMHVPRTTHAPLHGTTRRER